MKNRVEADTRFRLSVLVMLSAALSLGLSPVLVGDPDRRQSYRFKVSPYGCGKMLLNSVKSDAMGARSGVRGQGDGWRRRGTDPALSSSGTIRVNFIQEVSAC